MRRNKPAFAGAAFVLLAVLAAVFAPLLAPHDPDLIPADATSYMPPFWMEGHDPRYPLGTDGIARDELSRLIYRLRLSLLVGAVPASLITLVGVCVGLSAGWLGGRWDNLLMRGAEVVYAFPPLLVFIVVQSMFRDSRLGQALYGLLLLSIVLAVLGWVSMARLVRGQVLGLKHTEFVEAARSVGVPSWRILLRHVLPNSLPAVIVAVTFEVPQAILAEAFLTFIGLGIRPPGISLGSLIFQDFVTVTSTPVFVLMPTGVITAVVLSFTVLGDGLQEALNPHDVA